MSGMVVLGALLWGLAGTVPRGGPTVKTVLSGHVSVPTGSPILMGGVRLGEVIHTEYGSSDTSILLRLTTEGASMLRAGDLLVLAPTGTVLQKGFMVIPRRPSPPVSEGTTMDATRTPDLEMLKTRLERVIATTSGIVHRHRRQTKRLLASSRLLRRSIRRLPRTDLASAVHIIEKYRRLAARTSCPGCLKHRVSLNHATIRSLANDIVVPQMPVKEIRSLKRRVAYYEHEIRLISSRKDGLAHSAGALIRLASHGSAMALASDRRLFDDLKAMLFNAKNAPVHFMLKRRIPSRW